MAYGLKACSCHPLRDTTIKIGLIKWFRIHFNQSVNVVLVEVLMHVENLFLNKKQQNKTKTEYYIDTLI